MKVIKSIIFFLAFIIAANISYSYRANSENYNLSTLTVSSGGDIANSSNYKNYVAAGIIAGVINSSNYNNFLGFFYTWLLANGQPCTSGNQCEGGYCCSNLCASSSCPQPGGEVVTSGGGGGGGEGGGGGGIINFSQIKVGKKLRDYSVSPSNIKARLALGEISEKRATIKNEGDEDLTVSLSVEGVKEYLSLSESSIDLEVGKIAEVALNFIARRVGSFAGEIIVREGEIEKSILIILEVISKKILFDAKLDIPVAYEEVEPGKELKTQITLLNVGAPEKVDVFATYIIRDLRGNIVYEETETFAVEKQISYTKSFRINENTPLGNYVVAVEIKYADSFAVSSQFFKVVEKKGIIAIEKITKNATIMIFFVLILLGIISILSYQLISISKKKGKKQK